MKFTKILLPAIVATLIASYSYSQKKDTIFVTGSSVSGDDSEMIQNAIDKASTANRIIKLGYNKKYTLKHPLYFKNNVTLEGNSSTLTPVWDWPMQNKQDMPMLNIIGQSNVKLNNLVLDLQGDKRDIKHRVYCTLFMLGASNCVVDNVIFKNGGITYSENESVVPVSPHILMCSQDAANDLDAIPVSFRSILGSSNNNTVLNCKFLNKNTFSRFGIRVLSNWELKRNPKVFKNKTERNVFKRNYFEGEYSWNTLELAGGATVNNLIEDNRVEGKSINNLDLDKGASYNIIRGNTITNAGLPPRFRNDKTVRCSPIMVHGWQGGKYFAYNNVVENNVIENTTNPQSDNSRYAYSSVIGASTVDGLLISNNRITNAYQEGGYKNGTGYGGAIVLDDVCNNVKISRNTINNVNYGVAFTVNGVGINNIKIDSNKINSNNSAVFIPLALKGSSNKLSIQNNEIKVKGALKNVAIKTGNIRNKTILKNIISN